MKICRWCWKLVKENIVSHDCTSGEPNIMFFANPNDMIQALTNKNAVRAIKLQELVKERIKDKSISYEVACCERETCTVTEQTIDLLQSLVEESEK